MEEITLSTIGLLMVAVGGSLELAKHGLRIASRKINGRATGEGPKHVYKSDIATFRAELSKEIHVAVGEMKDYVGDGFRGIGERLARLEQRVDDNEK